MKIRIKDAAVTKEQFEIADKILKNVLNKYNITISKYSKGLPSRWYELVGSDSLEKLVYNKTLSSKIEKEIITEIKTKIKNTREVVVTLMPVREEVEVYISLNN